MLVVQGNSENFFRPLAELLQSFGKKHVSQFPVIAEITGGQCVFFYDSRFENEEESIATLSYNGEKYHLHSRLINNARCRNNSQGRKTKSTNDPARMLKYLKEYVKPWTVEERANRDARALSLTVHTRSWVSQPNSRLIDLVKDIQREDLLTEIAFLKESGVQFRAESMRKLADQCVELMAERDRRKVMHFYNVYILVQPNNSVFVVLDYAENQTLVTKETKSKKSNSWFFDSLDLCPECIRQPVALLQLAEAEQYVPEVGIKQKNGTAFWIHVPIPEFEATMSGFPEVGA